LPEKAETGFTERHSVSFPPHSYQCVNVVECFYLISVRYVPHSPFFEHLVHFPVKFFFFSLLTLMEISLPARLP